MINDEYFGFAPGNVIDSLSGTHFLFYYDLVISSPQHAFEGFIISSLKGQQNYEEIPLDRIAEFWDRKQLKVGVIVREKSSLPKIPFVYFWNKEKVPFSIDTGSLTIYRIGL
jgi:hypothetical protein